MSIERKSTPDNKNLLSQLEFRLVINKIPHVSFFAQDVNIPGISAGAPEMPTPFKDMPISPDRYTWEDFQITFKVDEDMRNYMEIINWIEGIGFPDRFEQRAAIERAGRRVRGEGVYSDGTLLILNSSMNYNIEVQFTDMFPVSVSGIQFDTTGPVIDYIEATATFKYLRYKLSAKR